MISRKIIYAAVCLLLTGCVMTPEMAKLSTTAQLCSAYASGENFLSPVVRDELIARQATYCLTPQYIQAEQAAAQARGAMMFQYGMQMMQNSQPYTIPMNQCVSRYVGQNLVTQCY